MSIRADRVPMELRESEDFNVKSPVVQPRLLSNYSHFLKKRKKARFPCYYPHIQRNIGEICCEHNYRLF